MPLFSLNFLCCTKRTAMPLFSLNFLCCTKRTAMPLFSLNFLRCMFFLMVQGGSPRVARRPPLYFSLAQKACEPLFSLIFLRCVLHCVLRCVTPLLSTTCVAELGKTYSVVSLRSTTINKTENEFQRKTAS